MIHPSEAELQSFINGQLEDEQIEHIATHLECCSICLQHLENFQNDPWVEELRHCGSLVKDVGKKLCGKQLGNYTLLEELGRGGMGVVYRAYDERLKRDVALKVISANEYADPEQRLRLRREAETTAALQHPGIVQIYDVGEQDEVMYIALELLHPGGLAIFHKQHGPRWYAALIKQIAETLHCAHQAGIVHRDIKPANILLVPSADTQHSPSTLDKIDGHSLPKLKITDFGLSKNLDEDSHLTRTGMLMGTPDYMAPEQIPDSGETVNAAADIYALGTMLYEMLSGRHPFQADSITAKIKMLRDNEPPALRHLRPEIPKDLETICLRCMCKKPQQRYATAQALAEDLGLFLRGEPIRARPLSLWEKLMSWARHHPILAGHLSAISLLYGMHLFSRFVLRETAHTGKRHVTISTVFVLWLSAVFVVQKLERDPKWQHLAEYFQVVLPMLLILVGGLLNAKLVHPLPSFFIITIMGAALLRPQASMVWFATVAAQGCFTVLAVTHNMLDRPPFSLEVILLFNVLFLLTGLVTYLLLRRISINQPI